MAGRQFKNRAVRLVVRAAALLVAGFVLLPQGRLACEEPYVPHETSPDGQWTLTLCRRPMLFSMPGGASDAPGWLVLRDSHGAIRGVSDLAMVQLYWSAASGTQTVWDGGRVERVFVVDLPLDEASGPVHRWLGDRAWRLRALIGWTPSDDELH